MTRSKTAILAEKGVLLGAINAICIAALYAAVTGGDTRECGLLECPWFVERRPQASQMFLAVLIHAMPVCILSGALVGCLFDWLRKGGSVFAMLVAVEIVFVAGIAWPRLIPIACATTIACGLVAEIWSYDDSWLNWSGPPRSTAHRDARSTDPTPTPSDTSRTTPSA